MDRYVIYGKHPVCAKFGAYNLITKQIGGGYNEHNFINEYNEAKRITKELKIMYPEFMWQVRQNQINIAYQL